MKVNVGDTVIVYDRYLFSVPVKGEVVAIAMKDGALQINLGLNNPGSFIAKYSGYYFHYQQCRGLDGSVIDDPILKVPKMDKESVAMRDAVENIHTSTVEFVPKDEPFELPIQQSDILAGAEDERTDPLYDGKIGYIPFAYHLVPRRGLAKLAAVMRCGERKGRRDFEWMDVPVEEHINHSISHLIAYMARMGGIHLAHAACRILMALDLDGEEDLPSPMYDPSGVDDLREELMKDLDDAGDGGVEWPEDPRQNLDQPDESSGDGLGGTTEGPTVPFP